VLADCQAVVENVVLGADPKAVSDLVHLGQDAIAIDLRTATSGRVQACIGTQHLN